jgi:hypothetical protein
VLKFTFVPRVACGLAVALFIYGLAATAAPAQAQATQPAQRRAVAPVTTSQAPAQIPAPSPTPAATATVATDNHDLSINANVTARELHFEVVPNPTVEFPGQPRRDTVWEAERTNLPAQVQPGVTYRDIGIRLKITSVFADIERIVAEALGELPARDGDNNPPTPEPNPNDAPPQIENAPQATPGATQTNAAPQAASAPIQAAASTQTPRAPFAQTTSAPQTAPTRQKSSSHATVRRGRHQ